MNKCYLQNLSWDKKSSVSKDWESVWNMIDTSLDPETNFMEDLIPQMLSEKENSEDSSTWNE